LIDDSPLSESVGHGLHTYHNYSRVHYGKVSLREALGNSLNIPAVKAMQLVGAGTLLELLHDLGIRSLDQHPGFYGDGLALGNGEISLFELVQAYSALARGGIFEPLRVTLETREESSNRVFSETAASLIGDILSDPDARRLEFGDSDLLNLPVQTAVKTGTSSDYRDAWAVGYDHRYLVGVWMGNLRGHPMKEITGSTGPTLVLRSLFSELNRNRNARPLFLSPLLVKRAVCMDTGLIADGACPQRDEWFMPDRLPDKTAAPAYAREIHIRHPHNGLQMALDPRIPDELEAFSFQLDQQENVERVDWYLNGRFIASSNGASYHWPLERGRHVLLAKVAHPGTKELSQTESVEFLVK
jgi:penicillin-binding protein 1C